MILKSFRQFFLQTLLVALATWSASATASELLVSAASSLTNSFNTISRLFEAEHLGTKVILNFGGSDALMTQIIHGAPVDVFASADQIAMDKAIAKNLMATASRLDFARNQVVIVVPADSLLKISSLKDLEHASIKRITLGNPASVPIGRYAQTALKAEGIWDSIVLKSVLAQNVRQSLDYVARGEVDAGFVFSTDAAVIKNKVRIAYRVNLAEPVTYPIAKTRSTRQSVLAQAFIDFVMSAKGQEILAQDGFLKP